MLRRLLLPIIVLLMAYGFWVSPTFKDVAAGVAVFLFGMLCMEEGFKVFSGGGFERLLRKSTSSAWRSLTFGMVTTTLMQSSSLVSIITISFLSAGLIGLAAGIGIIFGANLGTTTGAWIVAGFGLKVKISAYAMPLLVFGVLLLFQKRRGIRGTGWILVGLGFLFLGIHFMKEGFAGFSEQLDLTQYAVAGVKGLLLYTLFGAVATVIMQSSHATLLLIITALGAGQITYENALALAIGANVGTTITAVLGALSAPVDGKRLAGAHLAFNLGTGAIALVFIDAFRVAVDGISGAVGIRPDDYTLKLAVFHTLFNAVGVLVFTPLISPMARTLTRLLKGGHLTHDHARYLSDASLEFPEVSLTALRRETHHLFDNAFTIIAHGVNLRRAEIMSDKDLQALLHERSGSIDIDIDQQYDRMIKDIYSADMLFFTRAASRMPEEYAHKLQGLWQANLDIVAAIKATKHLRKNLVRYTQSPNLFIRKEYNRLRISIGELLADLSVLREDEHDAVDLLSLDEIKVNLADSHRFAHQIVDALIRDGSISAQMATSLMNDTMYANEIMTRLLNMAEGLMAASREVDEQTANLALTAEEVEAMVDQLHSDNAVATQEDRAR